MMEKLLLLLALCLTQLEGLIANGQLKVLLIVSKLKKKRLIVVVVVLLLLQELYKKNLRLRGLYV